MEERAYLSIGEVLTLLKQEFPDATISKIRFLESQGLLDPERTPSGYRKFYEADVERLRWILRQQREHFLPLKVIKGRLRGGGTDDEDAVELDGSASTASDQPVEQSHGTDAVGPGRTAAEGSAGAASGAGRPPSPTGRSLAAPAAEAASRSALRPRPRYEPHFESDLRPLALPATGVSMSLGELAAASGLDEDDLRDLERFGLLTGRKVASTSYYDEDALNVAHIAAGFMRYGVEARHLRMYKTAGEREAGFFEQLVTPMLKQRNPEARRQATEALADLSRLGQGLRAAMLRQALREYFDA